MKPFVLVVVCLILVQFAYSQEKEEIIVKDDIVLINKKGKSISRGTKMDTLLLKKEAILSITVDGNSVVIMTGFKGSTNSIYAYNFNTESEANSFFNRLMKKLYDM